MIDVVAAHRGNGQGNNRQDGTARPASVLRRPRRAPLSADRKRDPERTKEKILQAALAEFGEHGYAGARTARIADRAGVNEQLISYYFDGKAGLYQALMNRWRSISAELAGPDVPLTEVIGNFLQASVENRSWTRLLAWEGLTGTSTGTRNDDDSFFTAMVDDLRRRQQAGELAGDLDPAHLMLIIFAATAAPILLPQIAQRLTGHAPDSDGFIRAYREQLAGVLHHLRPTQQGRQWQHGDTSATE